MDDDVSMLERLTSLRFGVIALVAGTLLFVTERVWITTVGDGAHLPLRSAVGWWGANVGLALIISLGGALAVLLSKVVRERDKLRLLVGAALFAAVGGGLGAPLGEELTQGGWVGQQSWAWALRYLPALGLAGTFGVLYLLTGLRDWIGNRLGILLIGLGVGLVCVDHMVLLGTYPDLHLTLHIAVAGILCAGLGAMSWRVEGAPFRALATIAVVVAAAVPAFWATMPLGYRPQLSMSSSMANVLMERTMPRIELDVAEREFATVDLSKGRYLPKPRGDELSRNDWNVLFVTVDTLRWDALWPSRPPKGQSFSKPGDAPFLDAWLKSAVVFEHAYSQSSATHCSMPPMFKSLEAHEKTLIVGTPLGEAAASTGRTSIAVVNNFFLEPRFKRSQSLLWGFDVVEVYHKKNQHELVGLVDKALDQQEDGFFAWAHFYNMHAPGYGAKGLQSSKSGTWQSRYRISLKWLDSQFEKLVQSLERRGLADNTIIVFASDHGESLGANRMMAHGPTIYEEEVRVPLAIKIPGVEPRVVKSTVSNIDIIPTLWDAMALTPEATHRGRSLLPAMFGEPISDVPYYLENRFGDIIGAVLGDEKLIQKTKSGTTMRFDLATDPKEDTNLFEDGPADQPLLAGLYEKNPDLVVATPMMGEVAASMLAEVDPDDPGAALPYVLNIAARSEVGAAHDQMAKLFGRTRVDRVKIEVLRAFATVEPVLVSEMITDELDGMPLEREAEFVAGLAAIAVRGIDHDFVARRFSGPLPPDDVVRAWSAWMKRWDQPAVGPALESMTAGLMKRPDASPLVLAAVADLIAVARLDDEERTTLARYHRALLDHSETRVRTAAMNAAAALDDKASFDRIVRLADDPNVRIRQASLHALAAIDGERAVDVIAAAGKDPNLTLDAVQAMERTGSERGLPFITKVSKTHYNRFIRALARKSLKRLQKRVAASR